MTQNHCSLLINRIKLLCSVTKQRHIKYATVKSAQRGRNRRRRRC